MGLNTEKYRIRIKCTVKNMHIFSREYQNCVFLRYELVSLVRDFFDLSPYKPRQTSEEIWFSGFTHCFYCNFEANNINNV